MQTKLFLGKARVKEVKDVVVPLPRGLPGNSRLQNWKGNMKHPSSQWLTRNEACLFQQIVHKLGSTDGPVVIKPELCEFALVGAKKKRKEKKKESNFQSH